ncbi:MAG: DNA starvation/stationary phase protection protein [Gemmatimonadota bacterium]|nr:DNA starvation/stationary phase protection protein [Gemmatimonadota bacterium]
MAAAAIDILDDRLVALLDLGLTLKHIHWNVVGPLFIGVHEMLDPQYEAIDEMVDTTAERIALLGGVPVGTPGALAERRTWDDYRLGRATVPEHLGALEVVYSGVITDHRTAQARLAEIDPVSEDLMIEQLRQLEEFQWFVRAHLESASGELSVTADGEREAARQAADAAG